MSKKVVIALVVLILFVLLAIYLMNAPDAQAQVLDETDCHSMFCWLKYKVFVANLQQCLSPFCGQEHSGLP